MLRPPRLRPGDRVAVVAPSSPFDRERFDRGMARLAERYERHDGIHDLWRYAVAMPGNAVGTIAVEVDPHRIEPDVVAR